MNFLFKGPAKWWESLFNMLSRNATIIILPNSSCLLLAERETLNGLSMLDPLTGLYNRRGLQKSAGYVTGAGQP